MPQKTHTSFQKKAYDLRRRCSTGKPDEFQSTGRHSGRPHFKNTAQAHPSAFSEDPVRAYAYFYPSNTLKIYIFLHFSADELYSWDILLGYSFGISSNKASTAFYGTAFPKRPQAPCGPALPPYPGPRLIPPDSRGVAAHRHEANIG